MDRYQAAPVTWNIISLHEKKATSSAKLSNLSAFRKKTWISKVGCQLLT
jgi:hypothetical protein